MTHCSACGNENDPVAKFCASCGHSVQAEGAAAAAPGAPAVFPSMRSMTAAVTQRAEEQYASMRGMVAAAAAPLEQHHDAMRGMALDPGAALELPAGARLAAGKNPGTATLLSFVFPGGGQFYNGDTKKGLALLGLAFVAYLLTMNAGAWYLGVPLSLGAWVWGMLDAGKVARRERALW